MYIYIVDANFFPGTCLSENRLKPGLKVARPELTNICKKKFFFADFDLEAQKDFQNKLSMWEHLRLEFYRFCYFFRTEVKIFSPNFPSAIVVSKIPRDISTFVSIFVTKIRRKFNFLHTKTRPIDNFEVEHDWDDELRSFSRRSDRKSH